jgi:hypothetical protein
MEHFRRWLLYDKLPWDLGYPPLAEFDNIFPFLISQWNARQKLEAETRADFERRKQGR